MSVNLKLGRQELPDGTLLAVFSDTHFPNADEAAIKLAIECCEREGVTGTILNGDILDCGPASRHEGKKKRAVLDEGCLRESVATGMWFYDWARTRPCRFILGNHEGWAVNFIEESPELKGTPVTQLFGLWDDGDGWDVLPVLSRIVIGNLTIEHGDGLFKGGGGQNPAARIKQLVPDRSTLVGHLHRQGASFWTSPDENGVARTRGAYLQGHMSDPKSHADYMGSYPSWQQGFSLIRVYYIDNRPRFTVHQIEVHRDKRDRPIFEFNNHVYR